LAEPEDQGGIGLSRPHYQSHCERPKPRYKEERCGLCGSTDLRCDEDAATYIGGGFNVRVLCTNTGAEAHAGGFGLARDYSITPDEARLVGLV
jgi:hypothetical protein